MQKAAEEPVTRFAETYLFKPLEINDYSWHSDSKGVVIGGFGLSLKPYDLLKLGMLMMNKGVWKGKRIISEEWINESTVPRYEGPYFGLYGFHWWILSGEEGLPAFPQTYFARGYGGQYIIVVPDLKLVTVFTSDNYAETHQPLEYFRIEIMPFF